MKILLSSLEEGNILRETQIPDIFANITEREPLLMANHLTTAKKGELK